MLAADTLGMALWKSQPKWATCCYFLQGRTSPSPYYQYAANSLGINYSTPVCEDNEQTARVLHSAQEPQTLLQNPNLWGLLSASQTFKDPILKTFFLGCFNPRASGQRPCYCTPHLKRDVFTPLLMDKPTSTLASSWPSLTLVTSPSLTCHLREDACKSHSSATPMSWVVRTQTLCQKRRRTWWKKGKHIQIPFRSQKK